MKKKELRAEIARLERKIAIMSVPSYETLTVDFADRRINWKGRDITTEMDAISLPVLIRVVEEQKA